MDAKKINEYDVIEKESTKDYELADFQRNLTTFDEVKPIESPAFAWGNWGVIVS